MTHIALLPLRSENNEGLAIVERANVLVQVEKLVAAKVERGKNYRTLVNFSRKEMEEVNSQPLPLNSTLWRWHG